MSEPTTPPEPRPAPAPPPAPVARSRSAQLVLLAALLCGLPGVVGATLGVPWGGLLLGWLVAWAAALLVEDVASRHGPAVPVLTALAVGGALGSACLPAALLGDVPPLLRLAAVARAQARWPLLVAWLGLIAALSIAPLLQVRRLGAGPTGQLVAGGIGGLVLALALAPGTAAQAGLGYLVVSCLAAGTALGGAAWAGQTRAPAPTRLPPVVLASLALVILLLGGATGALARWKLAEPPELAREGKVIDALRAIHAAQERLRARRGAYAEQPGELDGVDRAILGGCSEGYLFRFSCGPARWAVAADPVDPLDTLHFQIDARGQVQSGPDPFPFGAGQ